MNYTQFIIQFLFVSFAVASISYTISKSELFSVLREYTNEKFKTVYKIISCPYCLSHWLAVAGMLFVEPILFNNIYINIFIFTFVCVTLSSFWIGMISRAFEFMVIE
jgi:hypothetical protein